MTFNGARIWMMVPLTCCLWLTACASSGITENSVGRPLQWPQKPLEPRIQWVKEIRDFRDAGINTGFWQRLGDLLFGKGQGRIIRPYGVLCDEKDRLFIVDAGGAVVHVMDMKNKDYFRIGIKEGQSLLKMPIAITEDEQDNLYITDAAAATVYRYSLKERELTPWLNFPLGRPTGIAFSRKKQLIYVTDTKAHQVVAFGLDGRERLRIGLRGDAPGQFNYPTDLFVDRGGNLLVTDVLNFRIQVFSAEGHFLSVMGTAGDSSGSFAKAKGVATDSDGHIYVNDALLDAVQVFDRSGRLLLDFGGNGSGKGEFWMPSGIYIDGKDRIYVADTYNRRVQVFKYLKAADRQKDGSE
ncbi:6-bladed beta-propeller [Geotalea sp. SG265]|uniref:6-bladed beta-propeller n=1 Tax=Geotalea sp. SG265 TaxID=2922867 RepID=UPI001FAFE8F0|nr:6-bladed beta-propeller [Geotalea sp. SG265]